MRVVLLTIILAATSWGQSPPDAKGQAKGTQKSDACDAALTFCWYGPYSDGSDEVEAWGNHWVAQDASEKALEVNTELRCVKRLASEQLRAAERS